jgi:hypothetical protein
MNELSLGMKNLGLIREQWELKHEMWAFKR